MVLTLAATAAARADAYVSPNGNDSNPGTLAQPYLTIQKCASTVTSGATCWILAGDYQETVTPNSGITIAPYQNQTVTIDGTEPVTGWTLYSGNVYRAAVTLSSGDTNQIFVNGQMMTEAQWPLSYNPFQPVWATAQSGTNGTTLVDSNLPNINWVGAHIHFWSGSDPWDPQTGVITASSAGSLTFTVDGASFPPYIVPQAGGYYFLFGALGALTAPSEWYYDSSAGYLYLWAPGGVSPNTLTVSAKVRQYGFDLSNASNVTIQGVNLFATGINSNSSSTNNIINGITATYVSQFSTLPDLPGSAASSYWYDHLGDSGIVLFGTGNVLENSTISYSAGNGVTVYGTNETVQNNLIHHVDYMANYASGIAVEGTGNLITHNTLHDAGRIGIYVHSIFDYQAGPANTDISYNNIFDSMLVSRDAGEIYTVGPFCATSSTIRYNWLHDTQSLYTGPADNFALPGVYLDNDVCGWQVYQNIVWNNEYFNIFIHGNSESTPNDNQVYNNSIPDRNSTGYVWLQDVTACGTTAVYNNYVLVAPEQSGSSCNVYNNSATAPGANMMNGVSVGCNFTGCTSDTPPCLTRLAHTHDFNGDCTSDILWRDTSGTLAIWLMSGGQLSSGADVASVPTTWSVAGTRDFNGDGDADILWQDSSGDLAVWLMNGATFSSGISLGNIGTQWSVAGTGDFNADGTGDILWRNSSTGDAAIWLMSNGQLASGIDLGAVPLTWQVAGTGDFNGDGTTDILWRNQSTGDLAIWFLQNGQFSSGTDLGAISTAWTVVGTGDFNGDGTSDILWRDSSGNVAIWLINNGALSSGGTLGQIPTTWSVAETGDFNGDGMSDILWLDTSGDVAVWLMNGTTLSSGISLGNVGTTWTVQGRNAD